MGVVLDEATKSSAARPTTVKKLIGSGLLDGFSGRPRAISIRREADGACKDA
jgi:hypothetical protein